MFSEGDTIRFGIKRDIDDDDYVLYDQKAIETETNEIQFKFEPEETKALEGDYIIEVEVTKDGLTETAYQENLTVKRDVIK